MKYNLKNTICQNLYAGKRKRLKWLTSGAYYHFAN